MGYKEKIQSAVSALAEIGELLTELGFRLDEFTRCGAENVVLQLNKNENAVNSQSIKKGEEELIKLKYGQGCIQLITRLNKKGSVYKIYAGYCYDEYGKKKAVYAKTQKDCLNLLRKANPPRKNKKRQHYITLKDWLLSWYNYFKKSNLRESSRHGYETTMNATIFPAIGNMKLVALDGEILQKFFNSVSAGNTRKKAFLLINAALKKAVILKKIPFNPCEAVELQKYKTKKRRAFTYSEQQAFLTAENKNLSQVFFFLCATGLRMGEFLALTKDDFFFEHHFFIVNKSIVRGKLSETKTESSNRRVYFTDSLFKYFELDLLGSFTYESIKKAFRRTADKLNIKDVSLHSTRHTFATICYALGMNEKVLQTLLGHSTLAMTQDVYTHLLKKGTSDIRLYLQEFCEYIRTTI